MKNKEILQAHALMLGWALLIATSFPAAHLLANKLSASSLTALRFVCASALFYPFLFTRKETNFPDFSELKAYSTLAACLVFYFWALFKALETTIPLHTGALFTLIPASTAVISWVLSRTCIDFRMQLALMVGCIGAMWVVLEGNVGIIREFGFNAGDLIFLSGCLVLSFYSPLIQYFRSRLRQGRSAVFITFWVMTIGAGYLLVIALFENNGHLGWNQLASADYGVIFYLAFFTTIITFWQLQYCTPILGSVVVMSYTYLIPSTVLLIDGLFFGMSVANTAYTGVAITLLSLMVMNSKKSIKIPRSAK